MKNNVLIGGLIGGVALFFLGWLIYGILLDSYLKENTNQCSALQMDSFVWWSVILSNLVLGYFVALILSWSSTTGMSSGLQKGAVVGLLMGLSHDLGIYGMTSMYSKMTVLFVDVAATTVMYAIAGGAIGWYMGMGKKTA